MPIIIVHKNRNKTSHSAIHCIRGEGRRTVDHDERQGVVTLHNAYPSGSVNESMKTLNIENAARDEPMTRLSAIRYISVTIILYIILCHIYTLCTIRY